MAALRPRFRIQDEGYRDGTVPALHPVSCILYLVSDFGVFMQALDKALAQVGSVLLGKPEQLKLALACMLAGGHLLIEALPGMGLPVVGGAEGAFYLYLDVSAHTDDSFAFCRDLLERTGVALTPGLDFGAHHHPERYLRLAYTCEESRLHEALERLRAYLERP